jgi:DNA repair protein RadC
MKTIKSKLIMIKEKDIEYEKLNSPYLVYEFLKDKLELHKEPEEVVMLLSLDNKKNLISCCEVSRGTIDKTILNPREVYKRALVSNAKSIIIAHNHPSGIAEASEEDKVVTKIIKEAGIILDVNLLDHIIVGKENYYSFFDHNPKLFEPSKRPIRPRANSCPTRW